MTLPHIITLGGGVLFMKVIQMALIGDSIGSKQLVSNFVIRIVFLIEKPHGVAWGTVVDDFKGIGPHVFTECGTILIDILELGA
jgi:hypothetical protein